MPGLEETVRQCMESGRNCKMRFMEKQITNGLSRANLPLLAMTFRAAENALESKGRGFAPLANYLRDISFKYC